MLAQIMEPVVVDAAVAAIVYSFQRHLSAPLLARWMRLSLGLNERRLRLVVTPYTNWALFAKRLHDHLAVHRHKYAFRPPGLISYSRQQLALALDIRSFSTQLTAATFTTPTAEASSTNVAAACATAATVTTTRAASATTAQSWGAIPIAWHTTNGIAEFIARKEKEERLEEQAWKEDMQRMRSEEERRYLDAMPKKAPPPLYGPAPPPPKGAPPPQ